MMCTVDVELEYLFKPSSFRARKDLRTRRMSGTGRQLTTKIKFMGHDHYTIT
jgi:hypothetical protein